MSPPATPGGSIFSPRQNAQPWSIRALTLDYSDKRLKLDKTPAALNRPMSPCGPNNNVFVRTSTLAARRMKRALPSSVTPLQLPKAEASEEKQPMLSTGLSPIISGLSIASRRSTPKPAGLQIQSRKKPMLEIASAASTIASKPETPKPEMTFRLQKPVPKAGVRSKAATVPRLNIGVPTGLISPPSATPIPKKRRPPPLSFGALASPAICGSDGMSTAPLSPSVPNTPSTGGFTGLSQLNVASSLMFGEASPSFYNQPTPPPVSGAPTFFVTPPSPAVVAPPAGSEGSKAAGESGALGFGAASSLSPCTPPWPKSGSSLRKTIFDHIGKSQLSPMDMRGYMAIAMSS
ncbi:hypothetical protein LPJ75_006718 [Coemansia sp. RSA 2598]|nr:hypothetical protein LPJ75_006718 [Coemansia sp. RSA 2598]